MKGQKPPAPIRGVKPKEGGEADDGDEEEADEADGPSMADLVPRNDIR